MTRPEIAVEKFSESYNCAQSVVCAFADRLQIESDAALKVSCCFGAGMGRLGEVCGAVTGGNMVLGLLFGRGEGQERSAAEAAYAMTGRFMTMFSETHGTYICRDLLSGCDLTTVAGQEEFSDKDLKNRVCVNCVRTAVEILEDLV